MAYARTTDLDDFLSRCRASTRTFYEYWDSKRHGRPMPARNDLDPVEMKSWLVSVQLVDVQNEQGRFVYRLAGQREIEVRGYNPVGKSVEEAFVGYHVKEALKNYEMVVARKSFVYDWADYLSPSGMRLKQEALLLPLSDDGRNVNVIVTYAETDEPYLNFETAAQRASA